MNIFLAYHHGWHQAGYIHEKYFKALGHEVFDVRLEETPYWTDWSNRLPFYFTKGIAVSVQSLMKKFQKKIDLVIEIDGSGQHHLSGMRHLDVPTLLWSMDTHVPVKRKFQIYIQKDFDIILTCHKDYTGYFQKTKCEWMPVACDPDIHRPYNLPKIYDVAFFGNADPKVYPDRVMMLQSLSKKFKVGMFSKIFGAEAIKVWSQTKIAFNKSYNGDLNHRVFEVLACGTFLLTDKIENGLLGLFQDGKHLVVYNDFNDLEKKVDYYLKHDQEREEIARCGQKEVLEKHTYYIRAQQILDIMNKL